MKQSDFSNLFVFFFVFFHVHAVQVKNLDGPRILAIRLDHTDKMSYYNREGQITLQYGTKAKLKIIGTGLKDNIDILITTRKLKYGTECIFKNSSNATKQTNKTILGHGNTLYLNSDDFFAPKGTYYLCLEVNNTFIHQGTGKQVSVKVQRRHIAAHLPVWSNYVILSILLCLSGLFSGLNLGLMSLNPTDLKIIAKTGTQSEKYNASAILPVRICGNFLLCSILLGNVMVNSLIAIIFDHIPGNEGWIAVLGSTLGIVIFGEVIPQAVCSRYGLMIGGKTIIITKALMLITSPVAWPISKLLDFILGKEEGTIYNRKSLLEMLRITQNETDMKEEINILTGALILPDKLAADIMTPLSKCYTLSTSAVLDFNTICDIRGQGYSRIPVYEGEENNITHVILVKDLLYIDPDDAPKVKDICTMYGKSFITALQNEPLNKLLEVFKSGDKGHLAIVQDEIYGCVVGIITLEDIIEEIFQDDIKDEDDVVSEKSKRSGLKTMKLLKQEVKRVFGTDI